MGRSLVGYRPSHSMDGDVGWARFTTALGCPNAGLTRTPQAAHGAGVQVVRTFLARGSPGEVTWTPGMHDCTDQQALGARVQGRQRPRRPTGKGGWVAPGLSTARETRMAGAVPVVQVQSWLPPLVGHPACSIKQPWPLFPAPDKQYGLQTQPWPLFPAPLRINSMTSRHSPGSPGAENHGFPPEPRAT